MHSYATLSTVCRSLVSKGRRNNASILPRLSLSIGYTTSTRSINADILRVGVVYPAYTTFDQSVE